MLKKRIDVVRGNMDQVLAEVRDTKTKQSFKVVQMGKEYIGLVFAHDDIVKIPTWFFFMVARGTREAENRLLRG